MKYTAPRKNYKLKNKESSLRKNGDEKNYYKAQNLNLGTMRESSLEELQSLVGNQAMLFILEEFGNLDLAEGETPEMVEIVQKYAMNGSMQKRKEEEEMNDLIDNQKNRAADAVRNRGFATKHTDVGKPEPKASDWQKILKGFIQLVNVLKSSDLAEAEKEASRKEEDLLLDESDKVKRDDMKLLMTMIRKLPNYNGEAESRQDYFKVLRFMVSAGIDLQVLLRATGNYESQRNQMIGALGGKLPALSNDT